MKILVGYDGSTSAKAAVEMAINHAKAFEATVDVVCSMVKGTESEQGEIADAEGSLEYVKSWFEKENITCNTHLLIRGLSAGEDLVDFAKDMGVNEIIVGVRRRSKVGKLLLGSTAQYVILNAPCPVLTVK